MNTAHSIPPVRAAWRRRARRGVAALEAVIVLPLMVFIIIGGVELYSYVRVMAIMDRVAFTVASSLSIQQQLYDKSACTASTPAYPSNDICTYKVLMQDLTAPLDYQDKGAVVISVYATQQTANTSWKTTPQWTRTYKGTNSSVAATTKITATNMPPSIGSIDSTRSLGIADTVVAVELFYDYRPFVISGGFFTALGGNQHLYSRAFIRPRYSDLCYLMQDETTTPPTTDPTTPSTGFICGS